VLECAGRFGQRYTGQYDSLFSAANCCFQFSLFHRPIFPELPNFQEFYELWEQQDPKRPPVAQPTASNPKRSGHGSLTGTLFTFQVPEVGQTSSSSVD